MNQMLLLLLGGALLVVPARAAGSSGNLLELVASGGWAMWPLGLCSVTVCYLSLHIAWDLRPSCWSVQRETLAGEPGSALERELFGAWRRWQAHACERGDLALHLETALARVEASYSARIQSLNLVAGIAPLFGLLGTVSGMIGAFGTLADGGMGRAELLAGDIGEALVTTAAGLLIGIPGLVAYFLLRSRLAGLCDAASRDAGWLADRLEAERFEQAGLSS